MRQTEALESLNRVIDEWNSHQPFLLITETACRNIYVRPHNSDGWQRFRAFDAELSVDDGPFGFGRTAKEAMADLVNNSYYQRLIAPSVKE